MASLLHFPIEVRLQIYDSLSDLYTSSAADQATLINPDQPSSEAREAYKSLLLTCKTIHHEVAPAFYGRCTTYVNHPYDFANTFLRRLTFQDLTMDKLTSIRHLEMKIEGRRLFNGESHKITYTKGEGKYWMDLVRVFDTYPELNRLDSLVLTLTRSWSDLLVNLQTQSTVVVNVANAFSMEREAQRMLDAAQFLIRRRLPHLALSRDVCDGAKQDLDPASRTYHGWIPQRIFTVSLRRPAPVAVVGD